MYIISPMKRLAALFFMPNTASLSCDEMSILSLFAMNSNTIRSKPARCLSSVTQLLTLIFVGVCSPPGVRRSLTHGPKLSMRRNPSLKFVALAMKRPP